MVFQHSATLWIHIGLRHTCSLPPNLTVLTLFSRSPSRSTLAEVLLYCYFLADDLHSNHSHTRRKLTALCTLHSALCVLCSALCSLLSALCSPLDPYSCSFRLSALWLAILMLSHATLSRDKGVGAVHLEGAESVAVKHIFVAPRLQGRGQEGPIGIGGSGHRRTHQSQTRADCMPRAHPRRLCPLQGQSGRPSRRSQTVLRHAAHRCARNGVDAAHAYSKGNHFHEHT